MRGCALTWPFCFGVRLGWATARTSNPDPGGALGRVYLLRGNAVIFSRGFGIICDRLRRAGLWAEDLRCVGDRWIRRTLVADQQAGRLNGPVILVGHSCGGRSALFTAQELARRNIPVDLLVCIDVAVALCCACECPPGGPFVPQSGATVSRPAAPSGTRLGGADPQSGPGVGPALQCKPLWVR